MMVDVTFTAELTDEEYKQLIACVEEVLGDKRDFWQKLNLLEEKLATEKNEIEASIEVVKSVLRKIKPRSNTTH
jgi:hypothetical protein